MIKVFTKKMNIAVRAGSGFYIQVL